MEKYKKCIKDIISISESKPQEESCGFIVLTKSGPFSIETRNRAPSKEKKFSISPLDFVKAKKKCHSIISIFHSHSLGDENPSELDLRMTEELRIPFVIYSLITKKTRLISPKGMQSKNLHLRRLHQAIKKCNNNFKEHVE